MAGFASVRWSWMRLAVVLSMAVSGIAVSLAIGSNEKVGVASIGDGSSHPRRASRDEQVRGSSPNVVIFVIDDQPKGMIDAMPLLRSNIIEKGVTFRRGIIPTSLCCPSRAALLTGNYSHTTGVYLNKKGTYGGWPAMKRNEDVTIATELNHVGYRTALIGKYISHFSAAPRGYIPPGWDEFHYFFKPESGAYYDYRIGGTNQTKRYGSKPKAYSTDVIAGYATRFIKSTPARRPLLLYFAPTGPHSPLIAAPRDEGTWPLEPASALPGLNEAKVADKPAWIRRPKVSARWQRRHFTDQHEVAMSVDDAIGDIVTVLGRRARNTLFVYMSDNGYMLGVHRLVGKDLPHRRSTEVPMFMRFDGHIAPNSRSGRVTTNSDLTATIADAVGVSWPMEGRSVLSSRRTGTVLEQRQNHRHPAYCGFRTGRYLYVEYDEGSGREFYDYSVDPYELRNGVHRQANQGVIRKLRHRAKAACSPKPPGFHWH
jgi:N-acetylglucosamine-6-sulfatase